MYSERVFSSSGALSTTLLGYLFNRGPECAECQPPAPKEQQFSLDFFQSYNKPSYSSLTLHAEIAAWGWIISVQAILSTLSFVSLDKGPDEYLDKVNGRISYKICAFSKKILKRLLFVPLVSLSTWWERMAEAAIITPVAKDWLFYFSVTANNALLSATSR